MTPRTNVILEHLTQKLRRQESAGTLAPVRRPRQESRRRGRPVREGDEAFGPESAQEFGDNDHQASQPGVGGAENIGDHNAALQRFMNAARDALKHSVGWDEGKADRHIRKVASDLADENMLPPLPSEGDENEAEGIALWLAAAPTVGFIAELLRRAYEGE
jgi:hypothetical protein